MSFDAPTPPSAPTPRPASNGPNLATWNIFDKIAVGAGFVIFVFSFFTSYVTSSVTLLGQTFSGGISAWHSYAVAGLLISFVAVALVVLKSFEPAVLPENVPWPLITAGAAALGWFLIFMRGITYSGASLGWSGWILVLAGIVVAAATIIPLTSYRGRVEEKLNNLKPGS